ncbi:MAG: tetratricopeptide repeat protein [Planctomycetes bacterium]|nr:tetratricopeptide repeat protein [Planctomycetota bacterium]
MLNNGFGIKHLLWVVVLSVVIINDVAGVELVHDVRGLLEKIEKLQLIDGALGEQEKTINKECKRLYGESQKIDSRLLIEACRSANAILAGKSRPMELNNVVTGNLSSVEQLIFADLNAITNKYENAMSLYDKIGDTGKGVDRVYAAEGMSDVYRRYHKLERSLEWINLAINVLRHLRGDYKNENFEYLEYAQYLNKKKLQIENVLLIMQHGIGFSLYKQAKNELESKRYSNALGYFEKLLEKANDNRGNNFEQIVKKFKENPDVGEKVLEGLPVRPVYEAAARFFRNEALIGLGEIDAAKKGLITFIKKDKLGLYRGDANRLLAEIALNNDRDPKQAIKYYSNVVRWVFDVRKLEQNLSVYEIPNGSEKVTAPPKQWRKKSGWGNVVWERPRSQAIVNRLSASWYLDALLVECYLQRSVCHFIDRNKKEAVADLDAMRKLDKEDRLMTEGMGFSNYNRLKDGYLSGRLYATQAELQSFPTKVLVPLISAELYFETEQWDRAISAYRSLIKEFEGSLKEDPMGYLYYALASAYLFKGDVESATPIIVENFIEKKSRFYKTISWPRSMLAMTNIDQKKDPWKWLWMGYEGTSDINYKSEFLLSIGQYHYVQDTPEHNKKAVVVFNKFLKEAKLNDLRRLSAKQYLSGLKQRNYPVK